MIKNLKNSEKFKQFFSFFMCVIAFLFSISSGEGGIFAILAIIIISGFFLAIGFAFGNFKNFKLIFLESLKVSFGISSLIYIISYSFIALEPIFT